MKIAIVGSRDFDNFKLLDNIVSEYLSKYLNTFEKVVIISGGARGADTLAEQYANKYGWEKLIFKADWKNLGKSAGYIRNKDIIQNADVVFAFWDCKSKGTLHSINLAKEMNKELHIIKYEANNE